MLRPVMRDPTAIFAAFCLCAAGLGIATVLDARARTQQVLPRVDATLERACIQTCPDCPPFCAGVSGAYFPPKP